MVMTSRERIKAALNHKGADKVPVDLGGTVVTGISASTLYQLRLALGIAKPGNRVKVIEPYQMLGEIDDEMRHLLGIDTIRLIARKNLFGFENKDWKPWTLFDGTPILVPEKFRVQFIEPVWLDKSSPYNFEIPGVLLNYRVKGILICI